MKKLLFPLIVLLALCSCTPEEDEVKSTYTLKYELPDYTGITSDLVLAEYNTQGERIESKSIENVHNGSTFKYDANKNTVRVKVYITLTSAVRSTSLWVQQIYYLDLGKNKDIQITGTTYCATTEP